MLIEHQHPHNKSIMVSILGAPNVGKSSTINYLLGMDLSAVSNRAQTTRNKFNCVFTVDRTEVVLVDTPGLHRSNQEINKRMNDQARESVDGADLNLLLIDLSKDILQQFKDFKDIVRRDLGKTWVMFTKCDLIKQNLDNLPLESVIELAKTILPSIEKYFLTSAVTGKNMHVLTGALCDEAKSSPHYYPEGDISNKSQRFFVTEYIREQAFHLLREEIPYEVAVVVDEYKDFSDVEDKSKITSHISASILVNRPSQRAVVIGTKGSMIKEIGTRARKKIEAMVGGKVQLNLHVKVSPRWQKNNFVLEELGLPRATDSNRVWRNV
jgi:GTP-binding protein Era